MALKRCPDCGEKYNDSYRYCPFCEEEEALRYGERIHRSRAAGGKRASRGGRQASYNLVTPTLVVLILLMAALLVYLLFGDRIGKPKDDTPDNPAYSQVDPSGSSSAPADPDVSTPGDMPEDPDAPTLPETSYEVVANLPGGLTLNKTDFTLPVGDPDVQLTVSGGSGSYTWVSQDPAIASVTEDGLVKALSGGTVNILVSDGNHKGTCIVRVKGGSAPSTGSQTTTPSAPTDLKLNKTDFTMAVGEMDVLLTIQGVSSGVTWTTSDASVATVNKGVVHAVGKGNCTVTASYNGVNLKCIVRVKGR